MKYRWLLTILMSLTPALAGPIAWTITYNNGPGPAHLVRFDTVTGDVMATVDFQGPSDLGGLAFNPANGELWSVIGLGPNLVRAVAINTSDGSFQYRSSGYSSIRGIGGSPLDLAFNNSGLLLFLTSGDRLFSYNPLTDAFGETDFAQASVGAYAGCNGFTGLANVQGTIVTSANCPLTGGTPGLFQKELRFMDAVNQTPLATTLYPFPTAPGAIYPGFDVYQGQLYGVWSAPGPGIPNPRIAALNPFTGATSAGPQVNVPWAGQSALAFEPTAQVTTPEPSSWATAALGMVAIIWNRRRHVRGEHLS